MFSSKFGLFSAALLAAACQGPAGSDGQPSLLVTTMEPPGANCAAGGTKVEVGLDLNKNGLLDASEVQKASTRYVCNGASQSALVKTSTEPAGSNCQSGGVKVESGIDANGNGALEPGEVVTAQTTYVCNGTASGGITSPSTGINIAYKSVSTKTTDPISVRFTMKDDRGFPIDLAGRFSINTAVSPRFALAYFTRSADGTVSPLTVLTKAASSSNPTALPTVYNPTGTAPGNGTLTENGLGAGDYTYTFPTTTTAAGPVAVAYDATKINETHVVWIQAARQTDLVYPINANTFSAADAPYYYIPSGVGTPGTREIVLASNCSKCHDKFRPETTTNDTFHGGGRVNATFCNVCHNPARTTNPAADSAVFVHRIHNGEHLQPANQFHGIAATYPQDLRNCDACHKGAAQGAQAKSQVNRLVCNSCHDYTDYTGAAVATCTNPVTLDASGIPVPCKHQGGVQPDDTKCTVCHVAGSVSDPAVEHRLVIPPDPNNILIKPVGGSANTNASYVAAAGFVPPGAAVITYDLKSVDAVADAAITPNKRPQITFKLKKDGADVVFQQFVAGTTTELMPNFVGGPSVYFAFAVPQDGNSTPADFNASVSGYIRGIWDGSASGTGAGTLTGPDASGYYTIKLTGVQIPPSATLLTGGVGYSYSLTSAPPLVQTNISAYGYNAATKQSGLSVPAPNVWKTATGYTGRRAIVDNEKCKSCHGALGVAPSFHAGQRNNGPTCSFCHNPNRTSSGWSAGSKYFIHAIHSGRKRAVPFTWHAAAAGPGFGEVGFPSALNDCQVCHLPNTYDFTAAGNLAAIPRMQLTTVATGKYNSDPKINSSYYTLSPYIVADNVKDYGAGFSFNAATAVATQAASTTLVLSSITGACAACHDTAIALDHMRANGGKFYAQRLDALGGSQEQCMICHGPGRVAAIGAVHLR